MSASHVIDRRRLLCLGAWGMVSVSLTGLTACGGSNGGDVPAGGGATGAGGDGDNGIAAGGTPGAALSPAQRSAALDRVSTTVIGLIGTDGHFDAAAVVQQLATSAAFQRVGVSAATGNAWAVFTDGRRLLIPNHPSARVATSSALRSGALARPDRSTALALGRLYTEADSSALPGLLASRQFRHLDMFDSVPLLDIDHITRRWVDMQTLGDIRRIAAGRGFDVVNTSDHAPRTDGPETGVEGLRQVGGDGVLFVNGYGAEVTGEAFGCGAISTTTLVTEASDVTFAADLDAARLTYMIPIVPVGTGWALRRVYAITPEFARFYGWNFPLNSIGIFNVTGGGQTRHWQSLLGAAGMVTLLTWDRPVSLARMLAFVEDLMHLCLATNTLEGNRFELQVPPRLRAYGIGEALEFLWLNRLTTDGLGADQIAYFPAADSTRYVNTLVPTTAFALIDDTRSTWSLGGLFGRSDGGRVASGKTLSRFTESLLTQAADPPVNGIDEMSINEWQSDQIDCDLGDFDCGYLQVFNGGRCSNVVRITRWKIPFTFTTTVTGGLKLEVTIEVQLRVDIRGWRVHFRREVPGSRNLIGMPMFNRRGAVGDFTASGEISRTVGEVTTTVSWIGAGSFNAPPGATDVRFGGTLDWVRRVCTGTVVGFGGQYQEREVRRRDAELLSDDTNNVQFGALDATVDLVFDSHADLSAGIFRFPSEPRELLGERTREVVLTWPKVVAEYPPSPDEGT